MPRKTSKKRRRFTPEQKAALQGLVRTQEGISVPVSLTREGYVSRADSGSLRVHVPLFAQWIAEHTDDC